MFHSRTYDADGFDSSWKTEKESCNASVQTSEFQPKQQCTHTTSRESIQVQTDSSTDMSSDADNTVDMNKLAEWLTTICPDMMKELDDMSVSSAMASQQLPNDNAVITANMIQKIQIPPSSDQDKQKCKCIICAELKTASNEPLFIDIKRSGHEMYLHFCSKINSSISWNSTGNTLAIACSNIHETWCYHQSYVNLYAFNNRDNILPDTPSKKLLCNGCITTLTFHPSDPSIIAAGTAHGEVYVWNYQEEGEGLFGSLTSHEDAITGLAWITNYKTKPQTIVLASASLDSTLIIWEVDIIYGVFQIQQKYATTKHNKIASSPDVINKKTERGIVRFDFSPHVSGLFVLAMEGGALSKCSLLSAKPLQVKDTPVLNPFVSKYEEHDGEVTSVQFSPHRRDLFLSCGSDNEIRIFNIDQQTPVQIIFMDITLSSVTWIIHEEKLLVGCGENGSIRLFSLLNGQYIPNTTSVDNIPLTQLAINKKRIDIAAFGNLKGQVELWSLPWNNIAIKDSYNVYGK